MISDSYKPDCRLFTGYKPCQYKRSCVDCPHYDKVNHRICVVSLEAMGAVLRSTCLLPPLRRKYRNAHITWVTFPNAKPLLQNNPEIDRLITYDASTSALLQRLSFDVVIGVDKSLEAGALVEEISGKVKLGFGLTPDGVISPLNSEATYQYDVGLDDELKFYKNTKPETQQITESMQLDWQRDEYVFSFTPAEMETVAKRKEEVRGTMRAVIGFNTGCSLLFPYKKLPIDKSIEIIGTWRKTFPDCRVALFGGREDSDRNVQMKAAFADDPGVVNTPCDQGLRSGIMWMDTADVVFSGCSLGMHIAISLKKHVVAWFGVSCIQEVDLYDRGVKIQSSVNCSPCWRKFCDKEPKCFNSVPLEEIVEGTRRCLSSID